MARARPRVRARGGWWRSLLKVDERRLAGYCAYLLAASQLVVTITYALLPGRRSGADAILQLASTSPGWFRLLYGALAAGGFFGLAVVGPITSLARDDTSAWLAWARRLAYVGFAVTIVQGVRLAVLIPDLAQLYRGCQHCTINLGEQQTMARWLYATLPVDPLYILTFGLVSLWTLALSVSWLSAGGTPRALAYLGLLLTLGFWLIVLGLITGATGLFAFASVVTGIFLGPFWYIWLGVLLTARTR